MRYKKAMEKLLLNVHNDSFSVDVSALISLLLMRGATCFLHLMPWMITKSRIYAYVDAYLHDMKLKCAEEQGRKTLALPEAVLVTASLSRRRN